MLALCTSVKRVDVLFVKTTLFSPYSYFYYEIDKKEREEREREREKISIEKNERKEKG